MVVCGGVDNISFFKIKSYEAMKLKMNLSLKTINRSFSDLSVCTTNLIIRSDPHVLPMNSSLLIKNLLSLNEEVNGLMNQYILGKKI